MASIDVLIVEDAAEYRTLIQTVVRQEGHRTRVAVNVAEAVAQLAAAPPDLVLLDLSLPDGDGLEVCRRVREICDAHVVMLTGRDDEVDKLIGFRLGADDYVTKPFSPRELAARIEAVARRRSSVAAEVEQFRIDDLVVRPASREARYAGEEVVLTRIEFDLLEAFVRSPQVVFTRTMLLEQVWGGEWYGDDHVVDVHVANLRKKFAAIGATNVLRTVRGVGYGLRTDPKVTLTV
jgi:DNA-binding response OmpR family regulator